MFWQNNGVWEHTGKIIGFGKLLAEQWGWKHTCKTIDIERVSREIDLLEKLYYVEKKKKLNRKKEEITLAKKRKRKYISLKKSNAILFANDERRKILLHAGFPLTWKARENLEKSGQ